MKPERVEMKTYEVIARCDCESEDFGGMKFTGMVLTSMPPQYPHHCGDCGKTENLTKQYPCFEYEER